MRRLISRIPLLALSATAALALSAAPASATSKHVFSTSFAGSGSNALSNPSDVDVDQASGDVYVTDPMNFRVEKFTASGQFILMFGKGVDATAGGDVCTAASGDECQAGAQGTSPGAFQSNYEDPFSGHHGSALYLAVDNSSGPSAGDVYVGDPGDSLVSKFDPEGHLIAGWGKEGQLDGTSAKVGSFSPGPELTGLRGVAVDPAGNLFVAGEPVEHWNYEFAQDGGFIRQFHFPSYEDLLVDGGGHLYSMILGNVVKDKEGSFLLAGGEASGLGIDAPTRELYVTREDGTVVHLSASCEPVGFELTEHGPVMEPTCPPVETFGAGHLNAPSGVAVDDATATAYVADTGDHGVAVFSPEPFLPSLTGLAAEGLTPASEKLSAHIDLAGAGPVSECHFEYGETIAYGSGPLPCSAALPISASTDVEVAPNLEGLEYATTYHFHLVVKNANGSNASYDETFSTLPKAPEIGPESVSGVQADGALVHVQIDPGGGKTVYRVEYVTDEQFKQGEFAAAQLSDELQAGPARSPLQLSAHLSGLQQGTTYHYRVIATNADNPQAPARGAIHTFTTLPFVPLIADSCPNAHTRQQTGATQLLDCRAYELVSAADSAGYDVESNLIAGQTPFGGYPEADGRVLYGVHNGGIPGSGNPTNRGVDPYVATRDEGGWHTTYVGVPANDPFATAPFSSPLLGADSALRTFAFGGPGICTPCFGPGGVEAGIPLRLPGGELVQGMAGEGEEPEARPDGFIAKPLSADGSHLIFGSTTRFAAGGSENSGDVSIYDRNLATGETHVVSNSPEGEDFPDPLPCLQGAGKCHSPGDTNGIAALDVSKDGSHVLLGQKVSEDADHNAYYHLYMDIGDSVRSIDLTPGVIAKAGGPGFAEGVLYAGMSADGSKVYFTTADRLLPGEDTDNSADLYLAEVSGQSATLQLVSTGPAGPSNSDACSPAPDNVGPHWNAVGSAEGCGAVAIGGGGGVAAGEGSVYFLSPEQLEAGKGVQDQPNLYLSRPGSTPRFIATLEPNNPLVLDAVSEAGVRHSADFQVTPSGQFAAFGSTLALAGGEEETAGHTVLYRYGAIAEKLDCVSCTLTGVPSEGDSALAPNGLSLTEDGSLFFDSTDHLVSSDSDGRQDAYQWEAPGVGNCSSSSPAFAQRTGECLALISAGTSPFDSGLLSATANGTDAYFFTRDSLAPQDKNGPTMKIYDARAGGGFPYVNPAVQCQASDECHGAASPPPAPLQVGSLAGSEGNVAPEPKCRKGRVKRHGACVKAHTHRHKSHKRKSGARK
jgi:DNA-binding beta-propeller fold protein YncE